MGKNGAHLRSAAATQRWPVDLYVSRIEEVQSAPVTLPGCPTWLNTPGINQCCSELVSKPTTTRGGFSWQLGALDPVQVRIVVAHYRHRYPALDWGWLLPALAELRLVGEPRSTVTKFLAGYQLRSAQSLIERFVHDVGLWMVEQKG